MSPAAPTASRPSPADEIARAVAALREGRRDEAAAHAARALEAAPDDVGALQLAGAVAFEEGRLALAVERFARATAIAPNVAVLWSNLGDARLADGDVDAAIVAHGRAVALEPANGAFRIHLGAALRRAGDPQGAAAALAEGIALGAATADTYASLGVALKEDGRVSEAVAAYVEALARAPGVAAVHVNLGNALGDLGRTDDAIACYEAALDLDPACAEASYNLSAAVYDEADPARAEACLVHAITARPGYDAARFQLGALRALAGDPEGAAPHLARLPPGLAHLGASLAFVLEQRAAGGARLFTDGSALLVHALDRATVDGLVVELGVRHGTSINFIAARAGRTVHGFDSFEGLPEAWGGVPKGAYSTRGRMPEVAPNVVLYAGWFADTLPRFTAEHAGPIRFLHIDCDLYASTRDGFAALGARLVPGSVVVFDDYLCNPGWEDDEHRALVEASRAHGFSYEYIAFSLFSRQAAIVVR